MGSGMAVECYHRDLGQVLEVWDKFWKCGTSSGSVGQGLSRARTTQERAEQCQERGEYYDYARERAMGKIMINAINYYDMAQGIAVIEMCCVAVAFWFMAMGDF